MSEINLVNRLSMLTPKIRQQREAAIVASTILPDEIALQTIAIYPSFKAGLSVQVGERYKDTEGNLYRVVQAHTTQDDWQPSITPALWTRVSVETWPEWVQPTGAQDAYNIDDKITFNGQHYISLINDNVWSPTDYPAGWQLQ